MSRGVNRVILIGYLGADPETRHMQNGKAVTNFRIATSESWRDKQTGDQQERTEWHSIVAFDKLAEIVAEYARKGSQVYVEGSLRTRKWQDKEGKDRYTTEINAQSVQLLGSKRDSGNGSESRDAQNQAQTGFKPPGGRPAQQRQAVAAPSGSFDEDGDIPFSRVAA